MAPGYIRSIMSSSMPAPLIGVTACLKSRDEFMFHSVGARYVEAVVLGTGAMPLLVPAIGPASIPTS